MNLSAIMKSEGAVMALNESLALDGVTLPEGFVPITGETKVVGSIRNIGQELLLDAEVLMTVLRACDRCLNDTASEVSFAISEQLFPESRAGEAAEKDGVVLADGELDLEELVKDRVFLYLPIKHLCSEDCKGLCVQCGADLNVAPCEHVSVQESYDKE